MAFVDDDEAEGFHRHGGVVAHQLLLRRRLLHLVERQVLGGFVDRLAAEDGIHALDGADAHLRVRVDAGAAETLHVVQLGELAAVIRRRVGHEFLMRLFAEVARIHQKQDAPGAAKLEQAIHGGDGGEGFARASGHVHQGAGLVLRQRLLQPGDGADLAIAQVAFGQDGHALGQAAAQGVGLTQPCGERFWLEKMENFPRTWRGVGVVGEADDLAGSLNQKTQRGVVLAPFEGCGGIALGLLFGDSDIFTRAVFLGLDDAHGITVDEQHVIRRAGIGRVFAHGDTHRCAEVDLLHVLDHPTGLLQLLVDLLTCLSFWSH